MTCCETREDVISRIAAAESHYSLRRCYISPSKRSRLRTYCVQFPGVNLTRFGKITPGLSQTPSCNGEFQPTNLVVPEHYPKNGIFETDSAVRRRPDRQHAPNVPPGHRPQGGVRPRLPL